MHKIVFISLLTILPLLNTHAEVAVGSTIKPLEGINQENVKVKLSDSATKGYVLVYFFPKADTPGCTKQACSLRDSYAKLQDKGVKIFGVSTDSPEELKAFKKKYRLPFDFISDDKKEWAKEFDVPVTFGFASRQAFLLKEGKIVWLDRSASTSEQAQDVLKVLDK